MWILSKILPFISVSFYLTLEVVTCFFKSSQFFLVVFVFSINCGMHTKHEIEPLSSATISILTAILLSLYITFVGVTCFLVVFIFQSCLLISINFGMGTKQEIELLPCATKCIPTSCYPSQSLSGLHRSNIFFQSSLFL